jgi:hypothetical protein
MRAQSFVDLEYVHTVESIRDHITGAPISECLRYYFSIVLTSVTANISVTSVSDVSACDCSCVKQE